MTDTTAREAASTAFYNDEGTTVSGLKAAFDAYEAAVVKMISDIREEAPNGDYDNGAGRDGWETACKEIIRRIQVA